MGIFEERMDNKKDSVKKKGRIGGMYHSKKKDGPRTWVRFVKDRIYKKNQMFLAVFIGAVGTGKSYACLSFAKEIDPTFNIERVVFSFEELNELLKIEGNDKIKKGSCIVFEEVGIGVSAKSHQSITNKMFSFLLQTMRHRNIILLMNLPMFTFLDLSSRKMLNGVFEMTEIDRNKKLSYAKPFFFQMNQYKEKIYKKYLKEVTEDNFINKIKKISFELPDKELSKKYEIKKSEFTNKLYNDIGYAIKKYNKKQNANLTSRQEEVVGLLKSGMSIKEVSEELGISQAATYKHAESIRKKHVVLK